MYHIKKEKIKWFIKWHIVCKLRIQKYNNMKTLKFLTVGLVMLSSSLVFGQKSAEEKATAQTTKMKTELGLSDDQTAKVKEINLGIIQKNEGVMNNASLSETQKNEMIKSNNEARKSMLKNVLTSEQYTKLELAIEKRKNQRLKTKVKAKQEFKEMKKD
jgi:protein CpxP